MKHVLRRLAREQDYLVVITAPAPQIIEDLADNFVVLRAGQVVAHESLDGLRRMTGIGGPLSDVLASLTSPETLENVKYYFSGATR